eukprot:10980697-Prorocentrum_lima.AAC.1
MSRTLLEALTRSAQKVSIDVGSQRVRTPVSGSGSKAPMLQPWCWTRGSSRCPARLSSSTCPPPCAC